MIKYCKMCLMPSTRPRIAFAKSNICNACNYKNKIKKINYQNRDKELKKILKDNKSKKSKYDCIVPWSGGKDSSYVAYQLKFKYGANPLLVTFSPLIPSKVGEHNRNELIKLGFDHVLVRSNQKISSYLSKRFLIERGNPKAAWDAGINSAPLKIAIEKNIKLIFYAEHGESHYGGKILKKDSDKIRDLNEVFEHQIGDDPKNWIDINVKEKDIIPYTMPSLKEFNSKKIKAYYFAYFDDWDVKRNFNFIKEKINFKCDQSGRSPGTFTSYDSLDDHIDSLYYHFQLVKFGFGRCWRDAARHIQLGEMEIKNALEYIEKYDDEIDDEDLAKTLNFLKISRIEFFEILEKHRNNKIWKKDGNKYSLINQPFHKN